MKQSLADKEIKEDAMKGEQPFFRLVAGNGFQGIRQLDFFHVFHIPDRLYLLQARRSECMGQ